jgi:RNA exonuclease 4
MAPQLSSNWKRLQATINSESTKNGPTKRHAEDTRENRLVKKTKLNTRRKAADKIHSKFEPLKPAPMGGAQSTMIEESIDHLGTSPSLALWAEENDISPEQIAEAYGLGIKDNSMITSENDKVNIGLVDGLTLGKYVAMDCEMVGIGDGGYESALARVSIVDFHGRQAYDSFVKPQKRVTDWRTSVSGISPKHMKLARDFNSVQSEVSNIISGRILVGHDLRHDLAALMLSHPAKDIRDTSKFSMFRKYGSGRKPALRRLAQELLGTEIQDGAHSSIEDARVTMLLFRRFKSGFDIDNANRFPTKDRQSATRPSTGTGSTRRSKKKRS